MKTVSRMIFCYLLAAFGIAFLVLTVNGALLIGVVLHYGAKGQQEGFFPVGKFAESFTRTDDGFAPAPDMEWQKHFAWAMLLGDDGEILWSENLPEELNHAYTVPEVAAFSRWYLKDYPVMAYRNDFGLLVAGKEQGSMTRFDFYMDNDILYPLLSGVGPLLIVDLCLVVAICLILGWRGAKPLREAAAGIGQLAEGKEVHLPQSGAAAELAEKLNQTSRYLQKQNELIRRRDTTRANWIAGVSHDIRTPLALIMGYGEQLAQQAPPQSEQQKKAAAICTQSQKIKALIEDLNLTLQAAIQRPAPAADCRPHGRVAPSERGGFLRFSGRKLQRRAADSGTGGTDGAGSGQRAADAGAGQSAEQQRPAQSRRL